MTQAELDSLNVQEITKYDRTPHELEAFFLLAVLVAGKNAKVQQQKTREFLEHLVGTPLGPIDYLRQLCDGDWGYDAPPRLVEAMKKHKLGQYTRLAKCFRQLAWNTFDVSLDRMKVVDLEDLHGVGPKTARFFLLHSKPGLRHAVLDTHILAWFRDVKKLKGVPKTTPGNRFKYALWENRFLYYCDQAGKTPAEMDLEIWNQRSKNGNDYRKPTSRTRNRPVRKRAVSV